MAPRNCRKISKIRSIGLLSLFLHRGRAADAGFEVKFQTTPAQISRQKELEAVDREARAAVVPPPPAASIKGAARCEEKGMTSPAKGGSLRAVGLILTAVVAVVVSILFLVQFHGHPMSQVWVLSVSICLYVFLLLRIFPSRWFYTDFLRLSYGPLLACFSASHIGSATTTFVLLFSMVYAAGNLGYSLAVHHLPKGAELAIHEVTSPSCHSKDVKELNLTLHTGAPFAVLLWTLVMVLFISLGKMTDELDILMFLCYFGWIHVGVWLVILSEVPMNGFPFEELIEWLMVTLFPWMILSPGISLISQILAVVCHLLLMLALAAFLWYNLAIYMHFLATTTPRTTSQGNKDTLHNRILEGKKSDPRLGGTTSEAAATLGNEDTLRGESLEEKIGQVKSGPRLGTTSSDAAATLGNENPQSH
ncbi:uncharacterized protein [Lolium perenne]|uniref:uncharacterized protein n=1 Tax=Lolium perenne TaxID=4522 RepID=UPI0021F61F89|nr:uncharacterized protein LOC127306481 [Lolium perenne]